MSTTRLPELPKAQWWYTDDSQAAMNMGFGLPEEMPLFTADQMHAYGLAVWKAAQEAAAKECERYEGEQWQKYKRGHGPERASDYCQGQSDGGGDCANAIRSLPLPEQGGPQ